ncbi:MAG: hypothetical protein GY926_20955 [bacterium]|nr:hypothetical protein [bacterium]
MKERTSSWGAAEGAEHRIDLKDLANQLSPRNATTLLPTREILILARVGDGLLRALGSLTVALASCSVRVEPFTAMNP